MSDKMIALRKTRAQAGAELQEVPVPEVQPGMVLIKIEIASICSSDQAVYKWAKHIAAKTRPPFTMGHEYCGKIVAVGKHVQHFSVNDRVVGETHVPCGNCYMCRGGNQHICVNMKNVGITYEGCFAEYILVPATSIIRVSESIDPKLGAILEPLGVAIHALQKTNPCGESLAVLGCGPIGLMTIAASHHMGAHNVFATSRTEAKLTIAQKMGANHIFNSNEIDAVEAIKTATNGEGVDIVIEASGSKEAFLQGLEILKNQGRFCLIGIPVEPVLFDADRYLIRKELNITGIWGRRMYSTWMLVEQLITSNSLNLSPIIGDVYPLDEYKAAFKKVTSGAVQRIFLAPA